MDKKAHIFQWRMKNVNKNGRKMDIVHNSPLCSPLHYILKSVFSFKFFLQHTVFAEASHEFIARKSHICFFRVPDWEGEREKRIMEAIPKPSNTRKRTAKNESETNTDGSDV